MVPLPARLNDVEEEQPVSILARSTWRGARRLPLQVHREFGAPPRAVPRATERSSGANFRSAASGLLESLVEKHEYELAERELEIARLRDELRGHAVRARTSAFSSSPERREVEAEVSGDILVKPHIGFQVQEQSTSPAQSSTPPISESPQRRSCTPAARGSVQSDWTTTRKQLKMPRMSTRTRLSVMSEAPVTWKMTADTVIHQASNKFMLERKMTAPLLDRLGCLTRIRRSLVFSSPIMEAITSLIIVLDMIAMGVDDRMSRGWSGWLYVDVSIAVIFTMELALKLWTKGARDYVLGPGWKWHVYEALLTVLAWADVASSLARLYDEPYLWMMLRFLRVARLVRGLRMALFYELFMMVNGVIGSSKTLFYSAVLVCIPLYCVALVLRETLGDAAPDAQGNVCSDGQGQGAEKFTQLDEAFFTVFRCFVASDCTQESGKPLFVLITQAYGWGYGVLYCAVQFFMTFGLFNVITAIYVESSISAAKFNDLFVKRQRFQDRQFFEEKAQDMLEMIWDFYFEFEDLSKEQVRDFDFESAGKLRLSREFFDELCKQGNFIGILRNLDISEDDQMDLFETLDVEGRGTIGLMELVIGIGKLRGDARKADLVSMGLILRSLQHRISMLDGRLTKHILKTSPAFPPVVTFEDECRSGPLVRSRSSSH